MKMKKRSNGSTMMKRKRKSFNWSPNSEIWYVEVKRGITQRRLLLLGFYSSGNVSFSGSGFYTSRDVYSSGSNFYTSNDLEFLQLPYSSLAPTSTLSSASSAMGMSSHQHVHRHLPLHSPPPPLPPSPLHLPFILRYCTFCEAEPSFGKVSDRIKNMWYTEFRVSVYIAMRYRWDSMHAIRDAWQKRASLRYKDLMFEVRVDEYQPDWIITTQYTSLSD
ncbi:hypothetical protein M9H77_35824 [Catharanthus roseus]|uniref:Uncharacterized protein n=1 Tax=Catharanthus roseus TaxID=4058 RepID=A0ACB9ZQ42_CATRO|nr:hypothetical protein M9H77_35824 [Catharanthus roseus]